MHMRSPLTKVQDRLSVKIREGIHFGEANKQQTEAFAVLRHVVNECSPDNHTTSSGAGFSSSADQVSMPVRSLV